jgi:hypothetical protein
VIAVDIALVLIAIAAITAGVTALSAKKAQVRAIQTAPHHRLGQAVRLLDRIVAADSILPSLPSELVAEAKQIIVSHYADH